MKKILILFVISLIFFTNGCVEDLSVGEEGNQNNSFGLNSLQNQSGELISGNMSEEEISIFFNTLKPVSYTISNSYFSKKNNSLIMDSTLYFQFDESQTKLKISMNTFAEGQSFVSDSYIIGKNDSSGTLTEIISYKTCMDMGGKKMCVDLTSMGENVNDLLKKQNLKSNIDISESVISYLGTKKILGVETKCFKMHYGETNTSNTCYHPNYAIVLENDIEDSQGGSVVKATELVIGNISSKEFETS